MLRQLTALFGAALIVTMTPAAFAQFNIGWYTVDGGGEMFSSSANFELSGTIGQPDTGIMAGGDFELAGGFWAGVESFCYGDLDGDREVGLADLAELLGHYATPSGASYEDGDLDGDGDVDLTDLAELLGAYGTNCP